MEAERARLAARIQRWNESCLDLFGMSTPDEALEFHAVVRFQVQAEGAMGRVHSTCVRVTSSSNAADVLRALEEKLQTPLDSYDIFELLPGKGERRLGRGERPLLLQLGWNPKGHHGSFILKPTSPLPAKVDGCESPSDQVRDNDQDSLQSLKNSSGKAILQLRRSLSGGSQREKRRSWGEKVTPPVMRQSSHGPRSTQQQQQQQQQQGDCEGGDVEGTEQCLPYLIDVTPGGFQRIFFLHCEETAIGCEQHQDRCIQDGVVTLVPCVPLNNLTYVDGRPIHEPVVLHNGNMVRLGSGTLLQFVYGPGSILEQEMMAFGNTDFTASGPMVASFEHNELGLRIPSTEAKVDVHRPQAQPSLPQGHRYGPVGIEQSEMQQAKRAFVETAPRAVGAGLCFSESAMSVVASGVSQPEPRPWEPSLGPGFNQQGLGGSERVGARTRALEQGDHLSKPLSGPEHSKVQLRNALTSELYQKQAAFESMSVEQENREKPSSSTSEGTLQRLHAYELCLPVYVEISSNAEEEFLDVVTSTPSDIPPSFSLGPAYTIYSACRFLLSSQGSCSLPSQQQRQRHQHIAHLTEGAASRIEGTVQASGRDMMVSGFWMANTSELLHFLEQDGDLRPLTLPAQEMLSSAVHTAFSNLVECLKTELSVRLPVFLQDPQTLTAGAPQIGPVLSLLTEVMSMLRTFKTNPALLVQIFARVFTLIAGWLFNSLLSDVDLGLRSRYWATTLQRRLLPLARWAEGQGLERAAACHLAHIVQATELLTMRKYEVSDVREILVTCYRLNSLQMRALLETYQYAPDEPKIPQEVIEQVVSVTRDTTDAVWLSQQQEVSRLESLELRLPFLVPGDGYACEGLAAIPAGLHHFLQPLLLAGLCKLLPQPWTGTWTVFFSGDSDRRSAANSLSEVSVMMGEPEIVQINLQKRQGLGFSIVAAKGPRQANIGIYIKSIIKGGAADLDGRIAKGDQLLSINGTSLIGISEKRAVEIMMKTGSVVALDVAKNAALFHNLADTLSHPTPLNNRARPKSESFTTQVWQERDHAQGSAAHSQVDVLRLLEVEISRLNCRHRSPLEEEQLQNLWIEYQSQLGSQHGAVSQLPLLHHPLPGTAAPRSSTFRPATSMLELSSDTLVTQSQYSHPALQARLGQALPAWSDHSLGPWEQRRHSPEPKQMEVVHLGTSQTRYKSPLHSNSKQRQPQSSPLSFVTSAGAPIGSRERTTHLSPTGEPKPPFQSTIPGINVNMRSDGERHNSLFSVSQHTVPQLKALQSPTYPVHSGLHSGGFNASVKHRRDSKQSLVESQVEMEAPMGSVSYTEPPADPHSAQSPSGLSPDLDPDLAAGGFRPLLFRAPVPQEAERSSPVPASRFSTGFSSTSDGNLNQLLQRGFFEPILNFSKNIDQTLNAVHQGLPTTQTNTDDFNANPYDLQSTVHFVENGSENQCVPILSHLLSPHKQTASPHETGELRNEFPCDCDRLVGESVVEDPPCRPRQQQQQPHEPTGARRHVPGFTGASIGESKGTRRTTCRVIPDVLSSISEEMWPGNAQQSTATELNFSTHIRDSKRNALGVMDAIQKPTHDKIFAVEQTRQLARNVQVSHDDVEVLPMIKNKRDQHANMSAAKESECIDQSPSSTMHKFAADGIKPQFVEMVDMKVQVPGGNEDPSRLSPYWNETKASAGPELSLTTEGKLPIFRSHGTNYAGPITPQHTTADIADEIKSEVVSDAWTSQRSDAHRKSRSRGLPRVTTETLTLALRETEESWEPQATGHVVSQLPSAAAPFAPQTYQFAAPTEHLQHSQLRVSPESPSTEPKVGEFSQGNLEISSSLVNSHFEADTKAIGLTNFSSGPSNKFTRYTSSFMEHFIQENIQMTSDQLESKQSPPKFELTRSSEDADSQWHVALMQNNRSPSDYYLDETHTDVEVMFCNNIQQAPEYSSHVKQVDFLPSIEAMDPRGTSERGMTEELSRHPEGLKLSEEVVHSQDARQNEPNKNNSFHPPLRSQLSSQIPFVLPGMQLCSDIKTHADIAFLEEKNPGASPQQGDDKPHDVPKGEISNAYANKLEQTADDRVLNNFQLSPVDQTIDTHWENLIHSQLDRYLESPLLDTTSSSSSEVPAVHSLVVPLLPSSLPLPLEAEMFTESAFPPPPSPSSLLVDDSPWVERTTEVGSANECVPCNGGHSHEHPDNVQFSRVTAHALRTYSSAPQDPGEVSWALGQASLRDGRPMRVVDVREGTARTDLQVLDKRDSFRAQKISGLRLNPSKGSGQHEPRPPVAVKPKSLTSMPQPVVQQSGKFMRSGVYKPHILRKQHSKPGGSADKLSSVGLREIRMGDEHQYSRDSPHHQHPPSPSEAEQDAAPGVETLPFNERLRLFRQRESQRKHT